MARVTEPVHPVDELAELLIDPEVDDEQVPPIPPVVVRPWLLLLGIVAGEWHNNHHLYPKSARTGFLPHQVDIAWCYIRLMYTLGPIKSFRDSKDEFLEKHYHKKELPVVVDKLCIQKMKPLS